MTRQEYLLAKGFNIECLIGPNEDVDNEFVECVTKLVDSLEEFETKYVEDDTHYIS